MKPVRNTAPEPLAPIPFNIPQAFETSLKNGLKVVIFEDRRLPLFSIRLAFRSGDANDPKDATGLTSAMTAMLTEGTRNYSSRALAEKIERLGASISANSSDDFIVIAASALSAYRTDILDLLSEIIFRPAFPENELDLYRRNTIENLKFQRSQPSFLANEQTARVLYGRHPYSKVAPKPEDIEKLTRAGLVDFHKRRLLPNNAVLIVVGDVERDALLKELEDHFGHWAEGQLEASSFDSPPQRVKRSLTIVDRPASAQSNIVLANLALKRNDPDYFPAVVMNQVLGAGASSRVFMNLREEKGYTYGAYTRLDQKRLAGTFEATAEVRTQVTGDSLKEFFYELNRIRNENVGEAELADAKNFLTGVFPIRAETQEGLTNLIVTQQLYDLPADYLQTYRDEINAVTVDDVRRVANKYIDPEKLTMIIVGDASEILTQAGEYAEVVEIFDTDGNPKDIAAYEPSAVSEPADAAGEWELTLDFQGQKVPVSLLIKQDGDSVSGKLETILGSGEITEGAMKGNRINATASTEIQGQTVDFAIAGVVDGDSISGTLSAALVPEPLSFTGTRNK